MMVLCSYLLVQPVPLHLLRNKQFLLLAYTLETINSLDGVPYVTGLLLFKIINNGIFTDVDKPERLQ